MVYFKITKIYPYTKKWLQSEIFTMAGLNQDAMKI
jgi:hypothetical protein